MAKINVLLDPIANTMNLWWGDHRKAFSSEETDDQDRNDVIVKDKAGHPIGVEIIGLFPSELNVAQWWQRLFRTQKKEPFLLTN